MDHGWICCFGVFAARGCESLKLVAEESRAMSEEVARNAESIGWWVADGGFNAGTLTPSKVH